MFHVIPQDVHGGFAHGPADPLFVAESGDELMRVGMGMDAAAAGGRFFGEFERTCECGGGEGASKC